MSSKVFEYFFDPLDLEPFYSRLPRAVASAPCPRTAPTLPAITAPQTTITSLRLSEGPAEPAVQNPIASVATLAPNTFQKIEEPVVRPVHQEPNRVRRLISVHALGQYVFCRRSAILAIETGDQSDVDETLPRLTYLPNFDREKIEEALSAKITQLGFFLFHSLLLIGLMYIGVARQSRLLFYPSFIGGLGMGVCTLETVMSIAILAARRRNAIHAEAGEPEPDFRTTEPVNWWSMLNAGYEPIRHESPFQHPDLPLIGAPWRVLQRGSQRIPVIKEGGQKLGNSKNRIYPKHEVRLVAYAMLLEETNHIHVPYGLVFPVDSPHGLAFPITDELRTRAQKMLRDLERTLADSQQRGTHPEIPGNRSRCANCDLGKPEKITESEVRNARKANEQLVVLTHPSGSLFHCKCADRFGSAPPHRTTTKLNLSATIG